MKKFSFVVAVCMMMCFVFAGCGGNTGKNIDDDFALLASYRQKVADVGAYYGQSWDSRIIPINPTQPNFKLVGYCWGEDRWGYTCDYSELVFYGGNVIYRCDCDQFIFTNQSQFLLFMQNYYDLMDPQYYTGGQGNDTNGQQKAYQLNPNKKDELNAAIGGFNSAGDPASDIYFIAKRDGSELVATITINGEQQLTYKLVFGSQFFNPEDYKGYSGGTSPLPDPYKDFDFTGKWVTEKLTVTQSDCEPIEYTYDTEGIIPSFVSDIFGGFMIIYNDETVEFFNTSESTPIIGTWYYVDMGEIHVYNPELCMVINYHVVDGGKLQNEPMWLPGEYYVVGVGVKV